MEDEVVLRQHGFDLRRSDLEFLKGPCFITDCLIDSYFQVFLSTFVKGHISIVPSSITYWLARATNVDDLVGCINLLNQSPGKMMLFPLNNDPDLDMIDVRPETHWSLLVFDSSQSAFIHFDNALEESDDSSIKLAMQIHNNFQDLSEWEEDKGEDEPAYEFSWVRAADPAKGFNKYDCGLHVVGMAVIICEWHLHYRGSVGDRGYEALIQDMNPSIRGENEGDDQGRNLAGHGERYHETPPQVKQL